VLLLEVDWRFYVPVRASGGVSEANGQTRDLLLHPVQCGVNLPTFPSRRDDGWTMDEMSGLWPSLFLRPGVGLCIHEPEGPQLIQLRVLSLFIHLECVILSPMQSGEIREKFLKFFEEHGHKVVDSSSVVPKNDPSVLFTTAGMQQFKPYYIGKADAEKDFNSLNLTSSQKCVRTSDIEEVGDDSHLTFFEMLGNFSFGGYWKKEAIKYAHELITKDFGLKIDYVSVFSGEDNVPEDTESVNIWKSIDPDLTVKKFGRQDNFWGPTGEEGPCGPTTEIYVDGIEVWNIVFNEYYQSKDGTLKSLEVKGVDTGMGLERLAKVIQKVGTVFDTDLFKSIMQVAKSRIVADHIRTSAFMIADGVTPSNTDRGYVLRRLLRRAYVHARKIGAETEVLNAVAEAVINHPSYKGLYTFGSNTRSVVMDEIEKFRKALEAGLKQVEKGADPFTLFTTYGLPLEIIEEITSVDREKFQKQMEEHKQFSSMAGENKFKK
jgi:alanyl-tRNA synthetase